MRVAVVGAGVSGLACARTLRDLGHDPVVFEKSGAVGGRVATRRIGDYVFDSGATSIAPRGLTLEKALQALQPDDLVRIEKPIYTLHFGRVQPGVLGGKIERFAFAGGNERLPRLLADGLDVRLSTEVSEVRKADGTYEVDGEHFERVVLTPPVPQAKVLVSGIGEERRLSSARYRPCIAVMLGYDRDVGDAPYHAIIEPEQRHPLTWLSLESVKSPGRAPEGHTAMVAQLSPAFSVDHFDDQDERLVAQTADFVSRIYGPAFAAPVASGVRRWRFSQPETTATFDSVNKPGMGVLFAGDGLIGGRVELAFEAGVRAANLLNAY